MSKRLPFLMLILVFLYAQTIVVAAPTRKANQKARKKQYIDLEGLQVQGLVDRPQTLYILKKSETTFKENFDEYDYMRAITDSIYKEPF